VEGTSVLDVDRASARDRKKNRGLRILLGRYLGEVVGKNDEVGVFAGFEFAFLPFLELRVGGTGS